LECTACANYLPRKEELLQAFAVREGAEKFSNYSKVFRDILKLCGPIIEIENDVVQLMVVWRVACAAWRRMRAESSAT
jgi:hypothetical protein